MIKYSSNSASVLGRLRAELQKLIQSDAISRQAAFDSLALVVTRIQQKGNNSQEQSMKAYSEAHRKRRVRKGRQTSYKDLTFTGDMIRDFTVGPVSGGWGVGFKNLLQSQKAKGNEKREGKVFDLSEKETGLVQKIIESNVKKLLS